MTEGPIENPNAVHIIGRRKPPIDLMRFISSENVDLGEVSTQETHVELQRLAEELLVDFLKNRELATLKIDFETFQQLREFVMKYFHFEENGTGISTVARQLESYKKGDSAELPKLLDCKFPTVMFGLLAEGLGDKLRQNVKAYFTTRDKSLGAHPSLIVEIVKNGTVDNFLFDAHYYRPDMPDEIKLASAAERFNWERANTKSVATLRNVSGKYGVEELSARGKILALPLNATTLAELDRAFLKS